MDPSAPALLSLTLLHPKRDCNPYATNPAPYAYYPILPYLTRAPILSPYRGAIPGWYVFYTVMHGLYDDMVHFAVSSEKAAYEHCPSNSV